MIYKVFSVYDSKVENYFKPFYESTKGSAIRAFTEIARDKDSQIGKYPEDFSLFELGSYDDSSAIFTLLPAPVHLGGALEFIS